MRKVMQLFAFAYVIVLLIGCNTQTTVSTRNIESIEPVDPVQVQRFDDFDFSLLPRSVNATLSDGSTQFVFVAYDDGFYEIDAFISGPLQIHGVLELPDGLSNTKEISVVVEVEIVDLPILDTLYRVEHFSLFASALEAAGLNSILALDLDYTVFAPNNDAILAYLETLSLTFNEWIERDDLADVLSYHILNTRRSASVLTASIPSEINTLTGEGISLSLNQAKITLNGYSKIVNHDYKVLRGVVHEIDAFLVSPSSIEDTIGDFFDEALLERFQSFLEESGLLLEIIAGGRFTILLPTEDAFLDLATELDMDLMTLLDSDKIIPILTYHVLRGEYYADQLYNEAPINLPTLEGSAVRVEVIDDALTIRGAKVLSAEAFEGIGMIYTIDQVLIPPSVTFD